MTSKTFALVLCSAAFLSACSSGSNSSSHDVSIPEHISAQIEKEAIDLAPADPDAVAVLEDFQDRSETLPGSEEITGEKSLAASNAERNSPHSQAYKDLLARLKQSCSIESHKGELSGPQASAHSSRSVGGDSCAINDKYGADTSLDISAQGELISGTYSTSSRESVSVLDKQLATALKASSMSMQIDGVIEMDKVPLHALKSEFPRTEGREHGMMHALLSAQMPTGKIEMALKYEVVRSGTERESALVGVARTPSGNVPFSVVRKGLNRVCRIGDKTVTEAEFKKILNRENSKSFDDL